MTDPTPAPTGDPTPAPAPAPSGDPAPAPAPVAVLGADPAPAATAAPAAPSADVVYDFKFAEGAPSAPDELKSEMEAWAKEHKLAPEAAQKAADFAAKYGESLAEKFTNDMVKLRTDWATQARADKDYGGDNFDKNMAAANAALQQFGSLDLIKVLQDTGLGNHPEMIRLFHNIHKTISQDSVAAAITASASADKTQAQRMYGAGS